MHSVRGVLCSPFFFFNMKKKTEAYAYASSAFGQHQAAYGSSSSSRVVPNTSCNGQPHSDSPLHKLPNWREAITKVVGHTLR